MAYPPGRVLAPMSGQCLSLLLLTRRLNRFESIEVLRKLVVGRLDSTSTPDTLLLLPSGIRVSGVESWVQKLADAA